MYIHMRIQTDMLDKGAVTMNIETIGMVGFGLEAKSGRIDLEAKSGQMANK